MVNGLRDHAGHAVTREGTRHTRVIEFTLHGLTCRPPRVIPLVIVRLGLLAFQRRHPRAPLGVARPRGIEPSSPARIEDEHLHVIPRWVGRSMGGHGDGKMANIDDLKATAARISAAL